MFEQPKIVKPPVSLLPMPNYQKYIQQETTNKHKITQQQSFIPSVGDIMSIKNKLRKVTPEKIQKIITSPIVEIKKKEHIKDSDIQTKNKAGSHKKLKKNKVIHYKG